jgi:hypothetical protein
VLVGEKSGVIFGTVRKGGVKEDLSSKPSGKDPEQGARIDVEWWGFSG